MDIPETDTGAAMRRLLGLADRVAGSPINVLLLGETGAGKEVLARRIHDRSPRSGRPFVAINCAGLNDNLVESELFGHERGAFTGALQAKPGLLEVAHGGTVFLDEVGETPPRLQAKLLRALETREVLPVGGVQPRRIDARFVAATNRDLEAEVARGGFRGDLYYRLNGITLAIPPLRERRDEVAPLARQFLERACREAGRAVPSFAPEAFERLRAHSWPGNIRELRNAIETALVLCDGEIGPEHLPAALAQPAPSAGGPERERILSALEACAWNQSRAARLMGMARRTFVSRLDAYHIPRPQKPAAARAWS